MANKKPNYIQRLTRRLEILYEAASLNLYNLILLLLVYLFYWTFPQAKDLLVTLNQEEHWQIFLFFATLINMAAICWYIPRYLYPDNNKQLKGWKSFIYSEMDKHRANNPTLSDDEQYRHRLIEMIPRLLGSLILFIAALGILNIGNEINPDKGFPWNVSAYTVLLITIGFVAALLLMGKGERPLLFTVNDWLVEKIGSWVGVFFMLILIAITFLGFINRGDLSDLPLLLYAAILIALAFLVFTVFRNKIILVHKDSTIVIALVGLSFILSLFFVFINIFPRISFKLNPLTCANLAFIFYLTILYTLRVIGVNKKVYFVFFTLLFVGIAASLTSSRWHHIVTYSEGQGNRFKTEARYSLNDYFGKWVDQRRPAIQQYLSQTAVDSFPIIIVSSEGGGSRAAYWTNITHSYLQNQNSNYYNQHLFALTGASGGNTGNSTFFSMKESGVEDNALNSAARTMFQGNFLSSSLTLLMGFDLWQSVVGLNLTTDRAKELEDEWTARLDSATAGQTTTFNDPFLSFWYNPESTTLKSNIPPLLLINTTHVQSGGHAVISPVTFDPDYYNGLDLLHKIDSISGGEKTLPISTATLLNASFPYINPAGYVEGVGSFVDAGYYDNYGILTAVGVLKQLRNLRANSTDSLYQKFKFISILIRNGTVDASGAPAPAASQFTAPVNTISKIRSAVNSHNRWLLSKSADVCYQVDLSPREDIQIIQGTDTISPVVPLARYLSPEALIAMDTSLNQQSRQVGSDLKKIVEEMQ